ncbi:MAG: alkaline phosphatase family protein, partial [Anaerolineae bacterium]|nr:alkaline phosphatase family protein [Anaerolineae bacterium]
MKTEQAERDRVLVIGIDGATFDLLRPWMDEGFLPNLAAIRDSGSHGLLRSTIPPITASAWSSFQTGKNPGKHGLFDFTQYRPGSYETSYVNASSVLAEPLWQILSRQGKRVVVINVPVTYPPQPVNGYLISGMLTPSVEVEFTYPPGLYTEMVREIADYQIFLPARAALQMGFRDFVDRLRYLSRKRAEAALFLMRRAEWDFFMVHFQSSDVLQHALWSHLDPAHPQYSSIPERDRDYARSYYAELDALIGQVADQAGPDTTVIVMSDHGFGPARKRFHINQWLANEGLLAIGAGALRKRGLAHAERFMRSIDVLKLRRRLLTPFSDRERLVRRLTQESLIDWSATRVYALPCAAVCRLQINCKDREPLG